MEEYDENNSNSKRFLTAYNNIDYSIRAKYNMNRSMGFSELIRKAVALNYVIRKYEDELIDFGRLRNAIIHNNEDYIIAEPHIKVVEKIEKIEKILTTPPNALTTVCRRDVLTAVNTLTLREMIKLISSSGYSNIPVYKDKELIGVANGKKILQYLGNELLTNEDANELLDNQNIGSLLENMNDNLYYEVVPASITVEQALRLFQENNKLLVVLVTAKGGTREPPLGILTGSDVITMNNVLENS